MADTLKIDTLSSLTTPPTSQMPEYQGPGIPPPNTPLAHSPSRPEKRVFWISPPILDPTEKVRYKSPSPGAFEMASSDDEDETPVEIVGEVRLGTDLFYWVVYENDVVHRHLAKDFRLSYLNLVDAYNGRKEEGVLEPFDDESPRIHPNDRIDLKITIPARKSKFASRARQAAPARATRHSTRIATNVSDGETDTSQDDFSSQSEDDEDDNDFHGQTRKIGRPTRRSIRSTAVDNKKDYRDTSSSPGKRRANPKRHAAGNANDEDDYDNMETESDGEGVDEDEPKPKKTKNKATRGRLSRPAYGNIRLVADLSDDESDDEAALRAHRATCERCGKLPAHELLKNYYKRGKRGRKKKKNSIDDFGDEEDEEQSLLSLGGWVRCLKCCVVAHWNCLGKAQQDEIIKAARSRDKAAEAEGLQPRKRETIDAYDTTEFICGACMKGGICMYCHETAVTVDPLTERKPDPEAQIKERGPTNPITPGATSAKETPEVIKHSNTPPPAIVIVDPSPRKEDEGPAPDVTPADVIKTPEPSRSRASPPAEVQQLLFRCRTCKRLAHYAHLPQPDSSNPLTCAEVARYYQLENDWECSDCVSFTHPLDKILAWRPYPANAVELPRRPGEFPDPKQRLPREYLVKWVGRSYRRLEWVPHMWLASANASKLRNFIQSGPKVQLLGAPTEDKDSSGEDSLAVGLLATESSPSFLIAEENSRDPSVQPAPEENEGPSPPLLDAEQRIPPPWRTADRVLDVRLWVSTRQRRVQQRKNVKTGRRSGRGQGRRLDSDDENGLGTEGAEIFDAEAEAEYMAAREKGDEPNKEYLETVEEWEKRTRETFSEEQAELVIWALIKWQDLSYEEATWDSPPAVSEPGYLPFKHAFQRFIDSRSVFVRKKDRKQAKEFDDRPRGLFEQKQLMLKSDPDLGQEGKLMDFQLTGVNWLFRNWWRHQPSILADEMGLGKTVQIACMVGHLVETLSAFPILIVVPNSTITNWLREFALWAPRLRVVPYYGENNSRKVIREYELYHDSPPKHYTNLKYHVLVTTYDTLISKDFPIVFKNVPRWELLIIDEGQRLKSDSSLLFRRLNELQTMHRILMTGTPLNNNIRELFNLMNFLDSDYWNDLKSLEKKYENLTEELLLELHEALKPYFLRRTKADVLKLPPKNEVIVPVSMTAIQKEVYKSILSQNMEILGSLTQLSERVNSVIRKSNLNNVLMQLRKCLQHPYLVSRELEPTGPSLTPTDVHRNLLDASAKLRLLHIMLPKLKAKGHRVLLFSQFVIALDIIEDFLVGEGHKFLRLDGNTKQAQRQKDMDAFNRPDSDVFIFLLSTRAGGVGVNLWSADTVIIFDPDFNPHQDLQAISRAHRYGQTKTVLVFKLMVKGAAEERIVQTGKKKLALDHLIVQKMDDEGAADDVKSILTYGAKAMFEGSETNDINYSDGDIDNLIARTEKEGDAVPENASSSFGFAKLWVVEKDTMEEVVEDTPADAQDDGFWGDILARVTAEKAKAKATEVTGRGAKRRAAVAQKYNYDDGSPIKPKAKKRRRSSRSSGDSDIEYNASGTDSGADHSGPSTMDTALLSDEEPVLHEHQIPSKNAFPAPAMSIPPPAFPQRPRTSYKPALAAIENSKTIGKSKRGYTSEDSDDERLCGLCQTMHGPGSCFMTENPTNLVDYRLMLIKESDEPLESRRAAVKAIDEHLASRGLLHLIKGQTLLLGNQDGAESPRKKHKSNHGDTFTAFSGT